MAFHEGSHHILIKWLAHTTRLFRAIQHRDAAHRRRKSGKKVSQFEWLIEAHFEHADLLAGFPQGVHSLLDSAHPRAHQNDHALRVRRAKVIEQVIAPASLLGKAIHHVLHDFRTGAVERIASFTSLKKDVGILCRAAQHRMIGRESTVAVTLDEFVVDQRAKVFVKQRNDFVHFVGSPEAVEEMQEGNPGFERRRLGDEREIARFLDGIRGQHGKTRRARRHDVTVVAEDGKRVRSQSARSDVNDRRGQLTRDLIHVGNHQQQTLGRCESRAKGSGLQGAVQGARGSAFALQFDHVWNGAPDVLFAFGAPLIGPFAHR